MSLFTKKIVQEGTDRRTKTDSALMSVSLPGDGEYQIVIGALYTSRSACNFTKEGIKELITELQSILEIEYE